MITIAEADEVLRHLPNEFDSHDFIEKYLTVFERDYVNMLINNIDSTTIFRTVNATIGRFLSNNQETLNIRKITRTDSRNVRGNVTDNQYWRKYHER